MTFLIYFILFYIYYIFALHYTGQRRNFCREEVDKTDHIIMPNKDALSSDQIFEFTLKSLEPSGHVLPATLGPTPIQLEPALYL